MEKEKCNCEYKMLAALVAGGVLGLVGGLAIGWGGAEHWSDTSFIVSLLTAVGTVVAAISASYAAWVAWTTYKEDKANRRAGEIDSAYLYFDSRKEGLRTVVEKLEALQEYPPIISEHRDWANLASKLKEYREVLDELDLKKATKISLDLRECLARANDELTGLITAGNIYRIKNENPLRSVESILPELTKAVILIKGVLDGVKEYVTGRGDGLYCFNMALFEAERH